MADPDFRRSSYCYNGACVEVAASADVILVRDSKHPDALVLRFTRGEWSDFLSGVAAGEFSPGTLAHRGQDEGFC